MTVIVFYFREDKNFFVDCRLEIIDNENIFIIYYIDKLIISVHKLTPI